MNLKQVIVWNHAIKVRKGKFGTQIAHASTLSFLSKFKIYKEDQSLLLETDHQDTINWLTNQTVKKIVVRVESEEELLSLYEKIKNLNIPHALVKDAGLTEFHGIPTLTCLGIGPVSPEVIDPYTGHLPLL